MKAICVDDEAILLKVLEKSVSSSPDIESTAGFSDGESAIEYAKENYIDIAFLDIEIHEMSGIDLAVELRNIYPKIIIIFCTGYNKYALDAFNVHANGYLTKPISAADVQKQIDDIKVILGIDSSNKLTVHCFGNFEVFMGSEPVSFKRSKSKELLAYLIDRKGASVGTGQITAVLWEDEFDEKKLKNHLYQVLYDLKNTLSEIGMEELLIKNNKGYSVNTEMLDCDYYKYLEEDNNKPIDEYMLQYSWAEQTMGNFIDDFDSF